MRFILESFGAGPLPAALEPTPQLSDCGSTLASAVGHAIGAGVGGVAAIGAELLSTRRGDEADHDDKKTSSKSSTELVCAALLATERKARLDKLEKQGTIIPAVRHAVETLVGRVCQKAVEVHPRDWITLVFLVQLAGPKATKLVKHTVKQFVNYIVDKVLGLSLNFLNNLHRHVQVVANGSIHAMKSALKACQAVRSTTAEEGSDL